MLFAKLPNKYKQPLIILLMQIIDILHIEDCFDGSYIKEFVFDVAVNEDFILFLGQHGQLSYFKTFARPFYKIIFPSQTYLKGVQGNTTARAMLRNDDDILFLRQIVEQCK
jgi:hypothetical protein